MNTTNKINPVPYMLQTIGAIPTSYLISMTYDEQLLCLKNYLETEVVPKMNENIDKVNNLIIFINEFFENLDLQEEVNNKIQQMYEDGDLQEIITSYLEINGILAFDTVSSMSAATNLIDGSSCKTLGNLTYNDGKGAFYKVRTITSGDTVDGVNIIALSVSDTLIAELLPDYYINNLIEAVNNINEDIDDINDNIEHLLNEKVVFVGDSYGNTTNSWVSNIISKMGLTLNTNAFNFCVGGAGFLDVNGGNNTYLQNLQARESAITDKSTITRIICCGGYNDRTRLISDLTTPVTNFINYCKTNYPNAKIYVGMIGNTGVIDDTAGNMNLRNNLLNNVLNGYKSCVNSGGIYLNGVENVMHQYDLFDTSDYIHPNSNGGTELSNAIYQAMINGTYYINSNNEYTGVTINQNSSLNENIANNTSLGISGKIQDNVFYFKPIGNIYFYNYLKMLSSDYTKDFTLATYTTTQKWIRRVNYLSNIPCRFKATLYNDTDYVLLDGEIKFNLNGTISVTLNNSSNKGEWYITRLSVISTVQAIPLVNL